MVAAIAHTRSDDRADWDQYDTPWWMSWVLLQTAPRLRDADLLFDPCGGNGAIIDYFKFAGLKANQLAWNEPKPEVPAPAYLDMSYRHREDASAPAVWMDWAKDMNWQPHTRLGIISNLPYDKFLLKPILANILGAYEQYPFSFVALLFRATFVEPVESRAELLEETPPTAIIKMPRYCWRKDVRTGTKWQTDACCHEWVIWARRPITSKPIAVVPKAKIPGYFRNPDERLPYDDGGLELI